MTLTREEMINTMVKNDIIHIIQGGCEDDNYSFLDTILRGGEGWRQYSELTDEEIETEYYNYITEREDAFEKKQLFKVGVYYEENGYAIVEANSEEDAQQMVYDKLAEDGFVGVEKEWSTKTQDREFDVTSVEVLN